MLIGLAYAESPVEAHFMPQFDPELIQLMRSVLDDVMSSVPLEISGTAAKASWQKPSLKLQPKVIRVTLN
jgi:hypothetical protein